MRLVAALVLIVSGIVFVSGLTYHVSASNVLWDIGSAPFVVAALWVFTAAAVAPFRYGRWR